MKDSEIISWIKNGKREKAFREIYRNYDLVSGMIQKSGGNEEEAKDIFQEAVIIFYTRVRKDEFTLSCSISTFLYSISRNLWLKHYRDYKRRLSDVEIPEMRDNEPSGSSDLVRDHQKILDLRKILEELGEPCLSILNLFYFLKKSMNEISEKLGYSNPRTVKSQKYKCMERIRKKIIKVSSITAPES